MWTVVPDIYNVVTAPHIRISIFNWMYLLCYRRYIDNSMWVILQPWCQYSAHPPDHAIWTVVPDIYNELTAPHIQDSIFNSTYLRRYLRYVDNSMGVVLQTWCQYSTRPPVYALWTVVPDIYNLFTARHIKASIFNWTYLRWYWRYIDNAMGLILQPWCQIQRTSSSLRYVNCGPGHIQCSYSSSYLGFNIQLNVSPRLLWICRQFYAHYTENLVPIQRTASSLRNVNYGPGHIQCIYSSTYSGINIKLNVSALV
jgi:hypothetical protein